MKRSIALAGLCLLVACSSLQVTTDYSEEVDFSTFETFKYRDSDENAADSNQLVHRRIVESIISGMADSGFIEVESGADLFATYYSTEEESVRFTTSYLGYGWPGGQWHGGLGMASTGATIQTVGTIVIDVWDASENELVWRSVVRDLFNEDPQRTENRIRQGIDKAFSKFPPS